MEPLELLYKQPDLAPSCLGPTLEALYEGGLELGGDVLYANLVSTLDGVVALPPPTVNSGAAISGRNQGDHFLMGLLRACAGCVVVGAGTLRADGAHSWTAGAVHPPSAGPYAELRRRLGLSPDPELVIVSGSGGVDPGARALEAGAVIYTTESGAARLRHRLPTRVSLRELPGDQVDLREVIGDLRARGHRAILTEGGPHLIGRLLEEGLLDQLFLTLSPSLAGAGEGRLHLVEGLSLAPVDFRWGSLLSVHRGGSHLFLRYQLIRSGPE